jgi:hypothetical protein
VKGRNSKERKEKEGRETSVRDFFFFFGGVAEME